MAEYQNVFRRVEKKYIITRDKYERLCKALEPYMSADEYGLHTICNVYYDTPDFELIRNSLEKPVYKEKLRVRSYGIPTCDSTVFVEIKKKYKGVVYKRRVSVPLSDVTALISANRQPQNQIEKEIQYFASFHKIMPMAYVAYDRIAMYGNIDANFRLTFDHNIRCRESMLDLSKGAWGTDILGENLVLMEIKIPDAMPMWMCNILYSLKIFPTSFSKYGTFYKNIISKKTVIGGHYSA